MGIVGGAYSSEGYWGNFFRGSGAPSGFIRFLLTSSSDLTNANDYFCWEDTWWGKNASSVFTPSLVSGVEDYSSFYLDVDFTKAPMGTDNWMLKVSTHNGVTLTGIDLYVEK
jgi:hypothetical protein